MIIRDKFHQFCLKTCCCCDSSSEPSLRNGRGSPDDGSQHMAPVRVYMNNIRTLCCIVKPSCSISGVPFYLVFMVIPFHGTGAVKRAY